MKRFIYAVLFVLCAFAGAVSLLFAGSDSLASHFTDRVQYSNVVNAARPPFNYTHTRIRAVDSSNWTPPSGVTIQQFKARKAGVIRAISWTDTNVLYLSAGIEEQVCVRKILDSLTTADTITFYGNR